jgi:uroporphyrinogen-III synthase
MATDLKGVSVVVTRPRSQAGELSRLLSERGATVIVRPTIEVVLRDDRRTVEQLAAITPVTTDAVLVTSGNAAQALATYATPAARSVPVFAVGSATADALRRQGFGDVRVGMVASGEGLLDYMRGTLGDRLPGMRLVAPQSSRAHDTLVSGLIASRAHVEIVAAYDTRLVLDGEPLPSERIDWITFTSPSAVEGFLAALELPPGARVACLGATTRDAAQTQGLRVAVVPRTPSLVGLVDAIAEAR